jgi:hypothetical protein
MTSEPRLIEEAVKKYETEFICEVHICPVGLLWCDCGAGEDLE